MGQAYTVEEVGLILKQVDEDSIGVVVFSDFVEWWTSD
jgi:hypothetical protein